ncbi:MAG: Lrp/AsnC family transcriptional regulator [Parvularculaceae bacterium]|nr:Lrp/AsnC family transcriptional regulator [Parvularculaceae bacterium]
MIDEIDRKILRALQRQCRQSAQELSEATGISAATCWRRLKALEESGVIKDYRAILDREKIGIAVTAFVHVTIERQFAKIVSEIEKKIRARPEVLECYTTTGDADFTLRVVARDIADYDRFLQTFLLELPEVGQVRSSIALREIKETTELPLWR